MVGTVLGLGLLMGCCRLGPERITHRYGTIRIYPGDALEFGDGTTVSLKTIRREQRALFEVFEPLPGADGEHDYSGWVEMGDRFFSPYLVSKSVTIQRIEEYSVLIGVPGEVEGLKAYPTVEDFEDVN